jgi:hypothetical protein
MGDVRGRNIISRMPEVLLEDPHVPCCMRIDIRGEDRRMLHCGIADNDTVRIIIARACILSRVKDAYFPVLQIVA